MTQAVPFTDNFSDLSNTQGYQFDFRCERCGNGYRSAFQRDAVSTGQTLLRSVGSLFGGPLRDLGNAADQIMLNRGTNSPAKDKALAAAVEEIADRFTQCRGCGDWMCRAICWNEEVGQCARCAPRLNDEIAGLQAQARRTQAAERLSSTDLLTGVDVAAAPVAACPSCGARAGGGKFCTDCGASLAPTTACPGCSAELAAGARFCADCGTRVGG
ncbi:hypothetical protein Cch01nite_14800 [Cellulomonas chitinilytica]|uniref:DZANK-type domain-containing protein n=1 Tax=Cellulomonas chitinilytica TaxID=398759 RepID=A0A919NZV7_9CELL|nr:zinc ribbon domain-containing protein [Cellulomonas chitinilytica]GIG20756.1 hypothetical protein Cch01nite_14800 [Cellulomonas chitinilytica]